MRGLCVVLLLGVVLVVGAGFYFHWWGISTSSGSEQSQIKVTIDKEKIREDVNKAREEVGKMKEEAGHNKNNAQPASPQP